MAYAVEISDDLEHWNSGSNYTTQTALVPIDQLFDEVTVRDNLDVSSAPRFMRFMCMMLTRK
ncbi:MAG: hypothetical protein WCP45_16885 [Verrucomicrobiota bacterium]